MENTDVKVMTVDFRGNEFSRDGTRGGGYRRVGPSPTYNSDRVVVTGTINLLLPAETTMVSAWVTEDVGGGPHAGAAEVMTWSVQLYDGGNQALVRCGVKWNQSSLDVGISVIFA